MKRFVSTFGALGAGLLWASLSGATSIEPVPGKAAGLQVAVEITPMFGAGTPIQPGYTGFLVRVQNNEQQPVRGEVEMESRLYSNQFRYRATAPFVVGAGAAVMVRLPAHASAYGDVKVSAHSDDGQELGTPFSIGVTSSPGVLLLDVTETSRLRGTMHDAWIAPQYAPMGAGPTYGSGPTLQIGSPRFDPATGDPVLPDRAAVYAPVSAVLIRSDILARVSAAELDALSGFVLGGGTLAVAVARPEDIRSPVLAAFAGGDISSASPHSETLRELRLPMAPSNASKSIPSTESPSDDVAKALAGFSGGNLRGTRYGASAYYGLGEFHLLAFDPTQKPAVDDPWAQGRVLDMTRRAFDRRSTVIYRQGSQGGYTSDGIRKQLDPNEGSRWAIAVAALLLIVYAIFAGPVNFTLNANKGKPLRALFWLPIFAAITFFAIVTIGFAAKGVRGRARHLTLVEAGAGMTKASARRWRGFFSPRAKDLTVRTTDSTSVVNTAFVSSPATINDHLLVDRDGARLVDVAALPWQTVVIREDGFADLGEGIAIVPENETDLAIINRSGRDLRSAIIMVPKDTARYFAKIKDGEKVVVSTGLRLDATTEGKAWLSAVSATGTRSGSLVLQPLRAGSLTKILDADAPGLADAWSALEVNAGGQVNWFPEDVPVLLAQLDGGEGRTSDTGLKLEQDRVLVRVVGQGGRP